MINIEDPSSINLTEAEKVAKEFLFRIIGEADDLRCDNDIADMEPTLPSWYDITKYKRAQKYFANNLVGILSSNMVGLICLLAPYKGVQILHSTGRSSTADTARKRYVSTILHTLCWYEQDLTPDSESWKSLVQVRKMHYYASKTAEKKTVGFITQMEMSFTQFGFMGFALIRPHIFGIDHDNGEDIEAFIHFWAVIGHMLGIKNEYNLCLHPVEIVKILSLIFLRYLFLPLIQLETDLFKSMTKAMLNGMQEFLPGMSYEVQLFLTRKALCVPGYQYRVDNEREILCRTILTNEDIANLLELRSSDKYLKFFFFSKVPVYKITDSSSLKGKTCEDTIVENCKSRPMDEEFKVKFRNYLNLDNSKTIELTFIDYETEWETILNDSKFSELDTATQWTVSFISRVPNILENKFARRIAHFLMSVIVWRFRKYLNKSSSR